MQAILRRSEMALAAWPTPRPRAGAGQSGAAHWGILRSRCPAPTNTNGAAPKEPPRQSEPR
jgi:hypothetical protein